jgi:hypothetical protein
MPFFLNKEQEGEIVSFWRLVLGGKYKERMGEGECSENIMYSHMKMEK